MSSPPSFLPLLPGFGYSSRSGLATLLPWDSLANSSFRRWKCTGPPTLVDSGGVGAAVGYPCELCSGRLYTPFSFLPFRTPWGYGHGRGPRRGLLMDIRHAIRLCVFSAFVSLCGASAFAQGTQAPSKPFEPQVGQAGKDVVWVPTPQALVDKMLDMAQVT